jgi:hypothetical protein
MDKSVTIIEIDVTNGEYQHSTGFCASYYLYTVICQTIRSIIRNEDQILIICSDIDTDRQRQQQYA